MGCIPFPFVIIICIIPPRRAAVKESRSAPITGAADEHYRCRYCNRLIMEVIRKQ